MKMRRGSLGQEGRPQGFVILYCFTPDHGQSRSQFRNEVAVCLSVEINFFLASNRGEGLLDLTNHCVAIKLLPVSVSK